MGSSLEKESEKTFIKLPMFLIKNILVYVPDDSLIKNCLLLNKSIHNAFKIEKFEFKKEFDRSEMLNKKCRYENFYPMRLFESDEYININLKDFITRSGSLKEFSFYIKVDSQGVWGVNNNTLNEDIEFIISDTDSKLQLYKEIIIKKRTKDDKFSLNIKKTELKKLFCGEKTKILWNLLSNSKNTIFIKCNSKMCINKLSYEFKNFYINRDQ